MNRATKIVYSVRRDPVSEPDGEAAWPEEIKRRYSKIEAGAVELIPWEGMRADG